jgi:hypothetical protein
VQVFNVQENIIITIIIICATSLKVLDLEHGIHFCIIYVRLYTKLKSVSLLSSFVKRRTVIHLKCLRCFNRLL